MDVTFVCPKCGQERTGARRRCYPCTGFKAHNLETRERIRQTLTGVKHPPERVRANSEAHKGRHDGGGFRAGHRPHNAQPVGATHVGNGHIRIKCPDGRWRYRARVMWEAAYGPIPPGMVIHHVNHDPFDDRLENFALITPGDHTRHHVDSDRSRAAQKLGVAARLRNREARGDGRY